MGVFNRKYNKNEAVDTLLSMRTLPFIDQEAIVSLRSLHMTALSDEKTSIYWHRFCGTGNSKTLFGTADGPTV